ncbi:MAG: hypothetical protein FJZ01_28795 [Candidatus Sericytochromatia bacterium]|nr:hypothetical protein [Candidatus Tanganyikabacteria bacterium]
MELVFKTTQTLQASLLKTAVMVEEPGGSISVVAEVYNHSDREIEGLAVTLAAKNELADVIDEAEVGIGFIPPLEKRLVSFKLGRTDKLAILDLQLKQTGAHRQI